MDDLMGQKVKIRYTGILDDGTEFDSSKEHGEVLEYVVGSKTMLPGFNLAVSQMQHVGEKKTIRIPAAEAYGIYNEELIEAVPLEALPNADQLPVGARLRIETSVGVLQVKVHDIKDGFIYLDHNHALANQDLTYEIELVGFLSAIEREHDPAKCNCGCEELKHTVGHDHFAS